MRRREPNESIFLFLVETPHRQDKWEIYAEDMITNLTVASTRNMELVRFRVPTRPFDSSYKHGLPNKFEMAGRLSGLFKNYSHIGKGKIEHIRRSRQMFTIFWVNIRNVRKLWSSASILQREPAGT